MVFYLLFLSTETKTVILFVSYVPIYFVKTSRSTFIHLLYNAITSILKI